MGVRKVRRWNGWGEANYIYDVSETAKYYLEQWLGQSIKPRDISLEEMVPLVPDSRLEYHPLISIDEIERIKHSVGQSLPDWIRIKSGVDLNFPDGVAHPLNESDVKEIISYAKLTNAIVIPYGGGTSVVGHLSVPVGAQPVIIVDMSRMNRLISIDKTGHIANFQAGVRGPELEANLRANGFTLGHFPQSFEFSTLGGWIASRSAGQFSLNYGRIEKLFAGGHIETPSGGIDLPPFPASAAGPDIREMVLGSEGRLGIITNSYIRISPIPETEKFLAVFFKNEEDGMNAVREIAQEGLQLAMLRLSLANETDTTLKQNDPTFSLKLLNKYLQLRNAHENKTMLIFGAVGSKLKVSFVLDRALKIIKKHHGIYVGSTIGNHWYRNRFRAPYLRNSLWELGYAVDTLETANIWGNIPIAIKELEGAITNALIDIGEKVHVFTHLSHVYPQGSSIYLTYLFRIANDPNETLSRWQRIKTAASTAIVKTGGTISHQHGVGRDHLPYLEAEKGKLGIELIKAIGGRADPTGIMNSGKLYE